MSNLNLKVPDEFHRGLKAYALLKRKSMSQVVIDTLSKKIRAEEYDYTDETKLAIEESKSNIGVKSFSSLQELFKDLGIDD